MVWAAQTFPGSTLIWNARFFSMNMSLMFFSRDRPSSYGSRVHVVVLLRYSITGRDARIASDSSASATHSSRYFHKRSKRMAIDVLQDVLDTIRLQGLITGIHTFTTPWGYTTTPDSHDIAFLVMVQGGGILEVEEGDPPVRTLQSGDIVVLPRRTRYILRDKMHSPVLLFTELTELQTQRQGAVGNTTRIASRSSPCSHPSFICAQRTTSRSQSWICPCACFWPKQCTRAAVKLPFSPVWPRCSSCKCCACLPHRPWKAQVAGYVDWQTRPWPPHCKPFTRTQQRCGQLSVWRLRCTSRVRPLPSASRRSWENPRCSMSNDGVCSEPHTSWTQETCHSKRSSPCLATHLRRHSARHSTSGMACCPVRIKKAYSDQEKRIRKRKRSASKERAEALLKTEAARFF